jgi:cobalt-zinc-cadmium efflux system protein
VIQSIHCLRGKVAKIANADCFCSLPAADCSEQHRQRAEKLLFPSLQELI